MFRDRRKNRPQPMADCLCRHSFLPQRVRVQHHQLNTFEEIDALGIYDIKGAIEDYSK